MARRGPANINLLIGIDKPVGITSHDAVARVRRALGERRVGHAGTLDPLASGVMVVGVGQATRLLGLLTLDRKRYLARIAFGTETSTDDAEGEVARRADVPAAVADGSAAPALLASLIGPQQQVPPAYSAISVDGVRSYRRARGGEEVELPARPVTVHAADLVAVDPDPAAPAWTVAFDVSKGTYVRALARDLGRAAGTAAHLAELRRTASGSVGLGACLPLDGLDAEAARARALDPVAALGLVALPLSPAGEADVACGRPVDVRRGLSGAPALPAEGARAALTAAGELRAVARARGGRLVMETVFPQGIGGVPCR